jgi:hypothetical protein
LVVAPDCWRFRHHHLLTDPVADGWMWHKWCGAIGTDRTCVRQCCRKGRQVLLIAVAKDE